MSQISLTVVQSGTKLFDTPSVLSLNTFWVNLVTSDATVSGANSKVEYHRSGPAGGSYYTYYVSETVTEIEALINGASPALTNRTEVAINATATMDEGDLAKGYITSTSAAGTAITTRTFAQISAELGANPGATYDFVIDNVGGASTVTLTPGANITAASALTGGTDMTVASTELAVFRLTFSSAAATVARLV